MNDISAKLVLPNGEKDIAFTVELVENPTPVIMARAQVKLANKLIFDSIQEIQSSTKVRTNAEIFEYVKVLDVEIDAHMEMAYKIKDRDLKKEIMEEISECKQKTLSIIEILRQTSGKVSNTQIA
jgi:hypothetical protein